MLSKRKIGFIGCGNIANAIISGFILSKKIKSNQIFLQDPDRNNLEALKKKFPEINISESLLSLVINSELIFICVKPHILGQVLNEIKNFNIEADFKSGNKVLISVCAGKTIGDILREFQSNDIHCIRVMPNLTLSICQGSWLYHENPAAHFSNYKQNNSNEIIEILSSCGTVYNIDESIFSHCTSISGCGPGFFSNIAHHFIESGVKIGIPKDLARKLVIETIYGTSKFLFESSIEPRVFQSKVSTPGGSTQAGIDVLEDRLIGDIFRDCLQSSFERCIQLSKN
ncbi:pyrroline-5-carboxylatase [Cryptosporidium ubiquitum]|uniref:Pyrroline-5-carboxylatase n=1 Tax=Cryptosporidium ubiquitum TaxID=857276 RepID=A0A1J4MK93_9CRYT|nr:pyrroline-5-carboxylatase [Cryptosporidium ubiquitum]OII73269.1 pyrroline-5-carboxylatase [Cryptosporidium ubiquitum]